jgi:hypothetical protein
MVLLKTKPHPAANLCCLRPPYYQSDMAPHRREISLDAIHSYGKDVDPLKLLLCLAVTGSKHAWDNDNVSEQD